MRDEIIDAPDFGMLKITFDQPGESVVAESGAMVAMGGEIDMQTSMRGGMMAAAKRKLLGGESLFQNTYTAKSAGATIYFSPPTEGDLRWMDLQPNQTFYLQSGAYIAHVGEQLNIDTKFGGVKGFFSGSGLFMLRITGPGRVYYGCYGAIHEVDIAQGGYTCDTGHILGWTEGLQYNLRSFGGTKGLFFSGEGFVCDFTGQGRLYVQTRNPTSLASFLEPFRPTKSS